MFVSSPSRAHGRELYPSLGGEGEEPGVVELGLAVIRAAARQVQPPLAGVIPDEALVLRHAHGQRRRLPPLGRLRVQDGDVGDVVVDGLVAADDHEVRLVDLGGAEVEEEARHLPGAHHLPRVLARVLLLHEVCPAVPVVVPAEDHHLAVEDAAGAVLPLVVGVAGLETVKRDGYIGGDGKPESYATRQSVPLPNWSLRV